jgi:hypothetical protein
MEPLLVDATKGNLLADVAAGASTITVENAAGFAIDQYLMIGEVGNENTEIVLTSHTVAPVLATGVVTIDTSTTPMLRAHVSGTAVYVLKFNQVEISNAPTVAGTKTVLVTSGLSTISLTTDYNDLVSTGGYYFARFKNGILGSTFSPYSDPAPYTGYTLNSARSIIDKALNEINKTTSDVLTDEFAFQQIDDCQIECLREFKRWSFMQTFNTIIGTSYTDQVRIALPSDCDDQQTTKSIYNFRLSKFINLEWIDKEEWDSIMQGIAYTTLASDFSIGATSIVLTSSKDFTDQGTVKINGTTYTYTANNKTTNTLTIPAATVGQVAGLDACQASGPGLPVYFTVWGGYIYFYPAVAPTYTGLNFYLDYYKTLTLIQHDSDNIVVPDPMVVQYYLQWKFLKKQNNGEDNEMTLNARNLYLERRERMKKEEWINRKFILKPA